ncbi:hypothetical protein G7Y89_g2700 [Cudoniella acicularis]|uniref:Uncharacterized protein n=1 Tax=Cudoniella acicularis TaxID=354080 RepID=A0A8H4W5W4_9HELO|nr:hypothetical protein G7Y89_g2700 [Cudoniella acicularis]
MWSFGSVLSLLFSLIISQNSPLVSAASVTATFDNSIQYKFDTDGNAIDSTSGKIDFLGGAYVWYGVSTGCGNIFCGIQSWTSTDLQIWHPNGFLFDPNTPEIQSFCTPPLSGNCGRPHIVYSPTTQTYVLWVNAGTPGYAIFTSSSPTSGYILSEDRALVGYQPPGPFMAGDFSVAVINGTGYVRFFSQHSTIVYSLIDFTTTGASIWPPFLQSLYLQPLTPTLTNTTGNTTHIISAAADLVDFEAESPDIFQRGDYYYITASNTCGFCTGTLLLVYRSKTPLISTSWSRQILSSDTCGGQSTGVLTLPDPSCPNNPSKNSYLHQADLFATAPLSGTRTAAHAHQFQLLNFASDGSVLDLDCSLNKRVSIPLVAGVLAPSTNSSTTNTTTGETDLFLTATDGTALQPLHWKGICNLPTYQLYQTFSASKTGVLQTISLNIAGDFPSGNLTVTVFRYENNTNFFTPRYVWETLATRDVTPGEMSQAFEVVTVVVGQQVRVGDRLGIALTTTSATPLCTLMTNSTEMIYEPGTIPGGDENLFAIGANQGIFKRFSGFATPPLGF